MKKLLYEKTVEPSRSLQEAKRYVLTSNEGIHLGPGDLSLQVLPGYIKDDGERSSMLFVIVSGGEKREKRYFNSLICDKYRALEVCFVSPQGEKSGKNTLPHLGSSPDDIKTYWGEIYKDGILRVPKGKEYSLSQIDRVFFLTDLDHFRAQLKRLLSVNSGEPYEWVISNPCFEIWLYYSYFNLPYRDCNQLVSKPECKRPRCLKGINASLKKGGIDPRKASQEISTAISNASANNPGQDCDSIPMLFGTQMLELAQLIQERKQEDVPKDGGRFKEDLRTR